MIDSSSAQDVGDPTYETIAPDLRVEVDRLTGLLANLDPNSVEQFGRRAQDELARDVEAAVAPGDGSREPEILGAVHGIAKQARKMRRRALMRRLVPFRSRLEALLEQAERANAEIEELSARLEQRRAALIDELVRVARRKDAVDAGLRSIELHMAALASVSERNGDNRKTAASFRLEELRASRTVGRQAAHSIGAAEKSGRMLEGRIALVLNDAIPVWRSGLARVLRARFERDRHRRKQTIRALEIAARELAKALPAPR